MLVALASTLGLVTLNTTARVDHTWKNVVKSATAINDKVAEFKYCLLMSRRLEKDFLLFYKTEGLQKAEDHYIINNSLYSQLERLKIICEEINLLMLKNPQQEYLSTEKIPKLIDAYHTAVEAEIKMIKSLETQTSGEANQIYTIILTDPKVQSVRSAANVLEVESRKMAESASNNANKALLSANKITQDSLRLYFWLTLYILLIAIIFAAVMIWVVGRSLKKLSLSTQEAIQGKLSDNFKSILTKIHQVISQITLVSNSMHAVSSREIALASEQSRAIRTAHDTAARILENVTQISEQLKKAANEVGDTGQRMQELRSQVHTSGKIVNSLNEFLHKIAKISESIAATEQINIIAMNASLEASRAAENQGSEFNPMMNSIRKLSDGAVKSIKDIAKLIENVNKEISQAAGTLLEAEHHFDSEISRVQGSITESRDISMKCAQEGVSAKLVADATSTLGHVIDMIISAAKEIEECSTQLTKISTDLQVNVDKFKTI